MTSKRFEIYATDDTNFCKETERFRTILYVMRGKEEFFADVSCSDFDYKTMDLKDMAIQFLAYDKMNIITKPYDLALFHNLVEEAKTQFSDMMDKSAHGVL